MLLCKFYLKESQILDDNEVQFTCQDTLLVVERLQSRAVKEISMKLLPIPFNWKKKDKRKFGFICDADYFGPRVRPKIIRTQKFVRM